MPFSNKRNQGSSEQWLILGLGHLTVPESKGYSKISKQTNGWGHAKGTGKVSVDEKGCL